MGMRGIIKNNENAEFIRYLSDGNIQLILFMPRDHLRRLIKIMRRIGVSTIMETLESLIEMYEDDYIYGLYVDDEIGEE